MSVRQIMKSRAIICTVPDERKAEAVRNAVEGEVTPQVPASILQRHERCTLYLDTPAASQLRQDRVRRVRDSPKSSANPRVGLADSTHATIYFTSSLQIAEPHFRRPAGVELQGEDAAAACRSDRRVDAQLAVEPGADVAVDGFDLVVVPSPVLTTASPDLSHSSARPFSS